MRFDLTDLRLYLQVLDAGSITAGAAASHLTLASASARIRAMEDSLQAPLLLRGRRGVQPTPAGRTLLHHARLVVQQLERLQGDLGAHGRGLQGLVRLLCNTSALSEHLPQLLGSFLAVHTGISVDLEERSSDQIADALRHGSGDIGLASDAADLQGLQTFPFASDRLVLVVPRGHALAAAGHGSVAFADVVDLPFVGLSEGSALQALLARQARLLGWHLQLRVRLRSLDAVCRMVGQQIGVAVVPLAVAQRCARAAGVQRVALSDGWTARRLLLCVRDNDALPLPAQLLLQHLQQQPVPSAHLQR